MAAAVVFYLMDKKRTKGAPGVFVDHERLKCESPIERRLYDALKFKGEYIRTQVPCGRYRIDIALPAYRIAIECDGKAYHSNPQQKARDRRKNAYLRANGWRVFRFSGSRITKDLKGVLAKIENEKLKMNT